MKPATRILLATPDFPPWDGGVSRVAEGLASGLSRLGVEVFVLCPVQTEGDFPALPYPVFRATMPKAKMLKPIWAGFHLRRLLKRIDPELVLATTWHPFGLAQAFLGKKPLVIQAHGTEIVSKKFASKTWQALLRFSFSRAEAAVAVSHYVAVLLKAGGVENPKVSVIENGVDLKGLAGGDTPSLKSRFGLEGKRVIITLSRLVERKGIDTLIRALPRVLESIPEAVLLIGGKGPEKENLRKLSQELGIQERVIFAGFVPEGELNSFYGLGELFVLPSREDKARGEVEGFGLVFLEAALAGIAAIGGKTGGVPEAISHGETGFLVEPNQVEGFAQAIVQLLSDEGLRKKLGESAKKRALERFTWDKTARRYLELFKGIVSGD